MGAVIFVGLTMVFLIFLILYGVFNLMGYIFTRRLSPRSLAVGPTVRVVEEEESEVVAVIAAVLSHVLGREFRVKSVRRTDRGFVEWRKTGWRGVRGWRGSSGL